MGIARKVTAGRERDGQGWDRTAGPPLMAGSIRRAAVARAEELIGGRTIAARIACEQRIAWQVQGPRARPSRPLPNARPDDHDRG
jgi:hypothetical protein